MCMTGDIPSPANLIELRYIPLEGCFSKAAKAASARQCVTIVAQCKRPKGTQHWESRPPSICARKGATKTLP